MPVLLRANRYLATPARLRRDLGSRTTLTSLRSDLLLSPSTETSHRSANSNGGSRRASALSGVPVDRKPSTVVAKSTVPASTSDTCLERVKHFYKRLHLNYLFPLVIMMVYMFLGALLFLWLEAASDRAKKLHEYRLYAHQRELFLKRIDEIFDDEASRKSKQRRLFFEEAIDYLHHQIGVSFTNQSEWSLATALYYSGTVFTTIGYGDVACNTSIGRFMTVIYAIVGIPLMLITLNDLGKFLYKTINNVVRLVRLKSRISALTIQKERLQQSSPDLVQLEAGEVVNNGNGAEDGDNSLKKANFQLSVESTEASVKDETRTPSVDEAVAISPGPPPRMPVLVAIGITVSWIFLCAALFKIWEHDWTYAESCYFMFISLSTIGLGDLSVRRRDLMVMCFIFVIIGLSMVSMCINVIQASLEDLYIKILMKLLVEYQSKLAQGDDRMGASMGMMQMWGSNKTAKYLMPLLSKNKRMTAMAKVQEDAEAQGIEIPPIFSDIDEESGMPKLFTHHLEESAVEEAVEEVIQKAETEQQIQIHPSPEPSFPKLIFYDVDAQTELTTCDDKAVQTSTAKSVDASVITDFLNKEMMDVASQCQKPDLAYGTVQTEEVERRENGCMTCIHTYMERDVQTVQAVLTEQQVQTFVSEVQDSSTQSESQQYTEHYVQTSTIETTESDAQTDLMEEPKPSSYMSRAKKRIRRALAGRDIQRRQSALASVSHWMDTKEKEEDEDVEDGELEEVEEQRSSESLDWDPVDGMHAEKQRPVRDLTKFFEVKSQNKDPKRAPSMSRTRRRSSKDRRISSINASKL